MNIDLKNVMVFDIETASLAKNYSELPEPLQRTWKEYYHSKYSTEEASLENLSHSYINNAGLNAEFSKVICISTGFFQEVSEGVYNLRLKSYFGHNEKELLEKFVEMVGTRYISKHFACAHNGKQFDIPFVSKRLTVQGIPLPPFFQVMGMKPWDLKHILDTKEMWSFGNNYNSAGLDTLCAVFGIQTPKDDIKGSDVTRVYWNETNGLDRIETYCKKDVVATAQVLAKILQLDIQIIPLDTQNQK